MKKMDIYWQDLNEDCQKRLFEFLGGNNGNYDVYPFVTFEIEDDEETEEADI